MISSIKQIVFIYVYNCNYCSIFSFLGEILRWIGHERERGLEYYGSNCVKTGIFVLTVELPYIIIVLFVSPYAMHCSFI